jgi:hypothetical protein
MNPATPPDPAPLSGREQAVLDAIAAHEHRRDAGFADALSAGRARRPGRGGWAPLLVLAVVMAVAVAPMVLPSTWVLAITAVALLVVVPTGLVVWALRQG